jgi:alpha-beta hydrolase superfamily lysophospholipase
MQVENNLEKKIQWKSVSPRVSVTNYSSVTKSSGYGSSKIFVKHIKALKEADGPRVSLFLLHDLGQHHGRFQKFIDWVMKEHPSYSIFCIDFVGHGSSSGTRGHFEKFDDLASDVHLLFKKILPPKKDEQWVLLGHGIGGVVALDYYNRFQPEKHSYIDGIVLSNFTMNFNSPLLKASEFAKTSPSFIKNIISHTRPLHLLKGEDLLSDSQELLEYKKDPLVVHRPTVNSVQEIQGKMSSLYQNSYFLEVPILVLKGESDPLIYQSGIEHFSKGVKKELLCQKNYSLMKHDLYNEVNKENVFNDIVEWITTYEK